MKNISSIFRVKTFLLMLICAQPCIAGTEFRLNSGAPESLSNQKGSAFYNLIADEIFKRLKLQYLYIRLPSQRALIQANNGVDDGNIARVDGLSSKWTNLVKVPESILVWEFTAYSNENNITIRDWDSLQPYSIGFVRGWQIYENKTKNAKEIILANSPTQLFLNLKRGRIKIALFERMQSHFWFDRIKYSPKRLSNPLAKKSMYIYLHKRHTNLIPKFTKAIITMKNDGTYENIYQKSFKNSEGN